MIKNNNYEYDSYDMKNFIKYINEKLQIGLKTKLTYNPNSVKDFINHYNFKEKQIPQKHIYDICFEIPMEYCSNLDYMIKTQDEQPYKDLENQLPNDLKYDYKWNIEFIIRNKSIVLTYLDDSLGCIAHIFMWKLDKMWNITYELHKETNEPVEKILIQIFNLLILS